MAWWSIVYQAWYSTLDTLEVCCSFCLFWKLSWQMSRALRIFIKLGRDANQGKRNQLRWSSLLSWCVAKVSSITSRSTLTLLSLSPFIALFPSITQVHNAHWAIFWIQKVPKIIEIVRNIWNLVIKNPLYYFEWRL